MTWYPMAVLPHPSGSVEALAPGVASSTLGLGQPARDVRSPTVQHHDVGRAVSGGLREPEHSAPAKGVCALPWPTRGGANGVRMVPPLNIVLARLSPWKVDVPPRLGGGENEKAPVTMMRRRWEPSFLRAAGGSPHTRSFTLNAPRESIRLQRANPKPPHQRPKIQIGRAVCGPRHFPGIRGAPYQAVRW
jgi:hypothetical protein